MSFSDTVENIVLDAMIGSSQLLGVNTLWVGLSTAAINDDASGLAEPSGNGYARVATVNSTNMWAAAVAGVKRNAAIIAFPTATGSWGNISDYAIWRDATSNGVGALVGKGTLGLAKNVTNGDIPQFGIGSLSVALT